uniref:non-specific serine/threonine protein kinase n=1 Tax=Alexandrium monilatum TaxID=311494 RepID=A0A7S4RSE4_9DINO
MPQPAALAAWPSELPTGRGSGRGAAVPSQATGYPMTRQPLPQARPRSPSMPVPSSTALPGRATYPADVLTASHGALGASLRPEQPCSGSPVEGRRRTPAGTTGGHQGGRHPVAVVEGRSLTEAPSLPYSFSPQAQPFQPTQPLRMRAQSLAQPLTQAQPFHRAQPLQPVQLSSPAQLPSSRARFLLAQRSLEQPPSPVQPLRAGQASPPAQPAQLARPPSREQPLTLAQPVSPATMLLPPAPSESALAAPASAEFMLATAEGDLGSPDFESRQTILALNNPQVLERCAGLLFRKSDLNGDGFISLDELVQLLPELHQHIGLRPPEEDARRLARTRMRKFDRNGDGVLSEVEFIELYRWALWRRYEDLNPPKFRRGDVVGRAHRGVPSQYYDIGKHLGAGAFGVIHEVTQRQTHIQRVMKTINKEQAEASGSPLAMLQQEIDVLSMLDHPHVCRLFEWYNDLHNVYIIMDECKGGELLELVLDASNGNWALPEAWVSRIFRQATEAIAYCHASGVMHKDLKFENVMLREKVTKGSCLEQIETVVIDVGMAELFGPQHSKSSRSNQRAGTPATIAPEVIRGDFSYKCDIWSLGCMLFAMFNSRPFLIPGPQGEMLYMYPFYPTPTQEDPQGLEALFAAQQRGPPMEQVASASPAAQEVILRMLQFSENLRPNAQECLVMPWLSLRPSTTHQGEVRFSKELVNAITQEREDMRLWRATVLQAASKLPGSTLEMLEQVFEDMDVRKRGSLSLRELAQALERLGVSPKQAAQAAEAADFDSDGQIEWSEFAALCLPASRELFAVSLQVAFQSFDLNQDGVLDPGEVLELLRSGSVDEVHMPTSRAVEVMVAELDRDCNGRISFSEFHDYFVHAAGGGGGEG